jgi:sporulation protein YlmC with PRC-barrel domain
MRLTDLRGKHVRSLDGKKLGRVHDVHADKGQVTALMCGAGSLIERLTAKQHGRRIAWEQVVKIDDRAIVIAPKPSASRNRQGTRRSSGQQSKR